MTANRDRPLIAVFGSQAREQVLLYIARYGTGWSRAIAQTYDIPQSAVWKQLTQLERAGVLVNRRVGRSRVYEFNPRYVFREELKALLKKGIALTPSADKNRWFMQRTRPRRVGKAM